jgi:predicted alpha/beta-fold hydrolase
VAVQALLVLAGLTGGSSEGYVMDLVQHANAQGFDCFVMIGRGLAGDRS